MGPLCDPRGIFKADMLGWGKFSIPNHSQGVWISNGPPGVSRGANSEGVIC